MMKRSMITNPTSINQSKPGSGNEPTNTQRRTLIGGALVALLSAPLLSAPRRVMAQGHEVPDDSFVLLLKGVYEPVVHAPDLGLSMNLKDGSYSKTLIYPVSGISGNSNPNKTVGDFYVQFNGDLCAYHVPGGSFAMRFTGSDVTLNPDGLGGNFLDGTFELTIEEGTGIYRSLIGGHNHMVDHLHLLADGSADEYCFCFISRA